MHIPAARPGKVRLGLHDDPEREAGHTAATSTHAHCVEIDGPGGRPYDRRKESPERGWGGVSDLN